VVFDVGLAAGGSLLFLQPALWLSPFDESPGTTGWIVATAFLASYIAVRVVDRLAGELESRLGRVFQKPGRHRFDEPGQS
jgi:hypothetical protein